jgi:hypothetical protein
VHVSGGLLHLSHFEATGFDGVATPVMVDNYGILQATFTAGVWFPYTYGTTPGAAGTPSNPAISITNSGTGVGANAATDIAMDGTVVPFVSGPFATVSNGNGASLDLVGARVLTIGDDGSSTVYPGITFDSAGGRLSISGSTVLNAGRALGPAVSVTNAAETITTGEILTGSWQAAYQTTVQVPQIITGSVAGTITGSAAIIGSGANFVRAIGNSWPTEGVQAFNDSPSNTMDPACSNCVALGGFNSVSGGPYNAAVGSSHNVNGTGDFASGSSAQIGGRSYERCHSGSSGHSQVCDQPLGASISTGAATRLTADGAAASTKNSVNIQINRSFALAIKGVCRDTTAAGNVAYFAVANGLLDYSAAPLTYQGDAVTYRSIGTGSGLTVTVGVDTTNGGLAVSATPPNTDTWVCAANVTSSETR